MKKQIMIFVFVFVFGIIIWSPITLGVGGIGIKWGQESAMVNEGESACLTYSVYNPWGEDSAAIILLGGELNEVLTMQEKESQLIPAHTSSSDAIPIEFCFKVPQVYERDCMVAGFLCELKCEEPQKSYEGEVIVQSAPLTTQITGTGGSATQSAVSAPLRIRVACNPHPRDYTLLYALIAGICALVIAILLIKKYRKPKIERDKEKLRKLRAEIARESKRKKPKKK